MMISPTSAGDVGAAASALDRQLRSSADEPSPDAATPDGGPDVVVSFGQGSASPATYDASGRMSGTPALDDLGANGPASLAHASESVSIATAPGADADGPDANANADQDAAVAA